MEAWKKALGEKALADGIIKDPEWLEKLDESLPLWAVLEIAFNLLEKLDPPCGSYD